MELRSGPGVSREGSRPAVVVRAEPLVSVGLNQHEVMVLAPRLPPHPSLHGAPGSLGPVRRALPLQNDNQWVAMFLKDKSSRTLSFGVAGYFGNEGKSCVLYGSDLCVSGENERAVMGKGEGKESREGRKEIGRETFGAKAKTLHCGVRGRHCGKTDPGQAPPSRAERPHELLQPLALKLAA